MLNSVDLFIRTALPGLFSLTGGAAALINYDETLRPQVHAEAR
jgi:hypothetical protein